MKKLFLRLRYAFCAIPFLLSAGCAQSIEEKPEATATQNPIEQAIDKNDSTPSPTPTDTPMDASFITPMPASTPVQIYIPTEKEQESINKEATAIYKRIAMNFTDPSKYDFASGETIENTINMINCLRGNFNSFDDLSNYDGLTDDQKSNVKKNITNQVTWFEDGMGYNLYLKGMNAIDYPGTEKFTNPEIYKVFALLEPDSTNFSGIETLKLIEEKYISVCNLLNSDWNEFEAEAKAYQSLIEAVFLTNDGEWNQIKITNFEDMSVGVKLYSLDYANIGLPVIAYKAGKEGKGIKTSYYTSQLQKKLQSGTEEGKKYIDSISQGFSELIDAYIAMSEQGAYDAYLTGDATRKAIIRTLCVEGKINLY